MTVGEKQRKFARLLGLLLVWINDQSGLEVSLGDAARMDRMGHMPNSKHYERRAIDLNLFVDGIYKTRTEEYLPLGLEWERLGGIWGGRFTNPDGNHFEL